MTQLATSEPEDPVPFVPLPGGARFVSASERMRLWGAVASARLLAVQVPPPTRTGRGRLRDLIESAIEAALEAENAPPAGVSDMADLDRCLSDQLFRARQAGALGFAVYIGPLGDVGNLAGALDAEDSAVLRWWISAAAERPVALLLDESNRALGAYGPPTRLDRLIEATSAAAAKRPDPPRAVSPPRREPIVEVASPPHREPIVEVAENPPAPLPPVPSPPPPAFTNTPAAIVVEEPLPAVAGGAPAEPARRTSEWRVWAGELDAARGPKPLATIERLFISRYVPLCEALARGEGDPAARAICAAWGASFAKSYTESFGALRVTGKRPLMVLDAPQMASRIARLHGAKATQLVLVDAMRFDLGLKVHERMRGALGAFATCTERLLLWAALPTNTPTQIDLIAHGPEGLALRLVPSEREEPGVTPRTAAVLRRIKVGGRDVMKLDLVEARLRETGGPPAARLDALADEVASSVVTYAKTLAPRTLLFIFGDHGFRMEPSGGGTGPGVYGGATPEEVLVPAFTWLIGETH
jgi:hypothetical protein